MWTHLGHIMLRERRRHKGHILSDSTQDIPRTGEFAETESGQCLSGVGEGDWGVAVDRKEASLRGDKNVLEVNGGDGCTTVRRY